MASARTSAPIARVSMATAVPAAAAAVPAASTNMAPSAVAEVANTLRQMIASGDVSPFNAVEIIKAAGRVGASWDTVEDIIAEIAKGADGIGGTADDVIPMPVMSLLRMLLRHGVVRDMAAWAAELEAKLQPEVPRAAAKLTGKLSGVLKRLCFWKSSV